MPMRSLREICQDQDLLTVSPETTIREAARRMADRHVGTVLVIDDGQLKGVLSERDLVQRVLAESVDADTELVADYMTKKVVTVDAAKLGVQALQLMQEHGIRHVVVTGFSDGAYGVVSMRDFVSAEIHAAEKVQEQKKELWEHV